MTKQAKQTVKGGQNAPLTVREVCLMNAQNARNRGNETAANRLTLLAKGTIKTLAIVALIVNLIGLASCTQRASCPTYGDSRHIYVIPK